LREKVPSLPSRLLPPEGIARLDRQVQAGDAADTLKRFFQDLNVDSPPQHAIPKYLIKALPESLVPG
jgi:hypothetical protein